jgi:hypothetical protein
LDLAVCAKPVEHNNAVSSSAQQMRKVGVIGLLLCPEL